MKADKTKTIAKYLAVGAVVAVLAPPVVNAATNNVKIQDANSQNKAEVSSGGALKIKGGVNANITNGNLNTNAKVQDSNGNTVESAPIGDQGAFSFPGSEGAMDVRTYAGGAGFLGSADCDAANPGGGDFLGEDVTVQGGNVITAAIMTGTNMRVDVKSAALGTQTVSTFRLTAANPQETLQVPTGLGLTGALTFDCSALEGGAETVDGNINVIGHPSKTVAP